MCHAGDILQGELEGEVEHSEVMEDGGAVSRTDVLLAAEGGDGDGVCPEGTGLHACEATVDVSLSPIRWGDEATVNRNKAAAIQGLDELFLGSVLGNHDVLSVRDSGEAHMQLPGGELVGVLR